MLKAHFLILYILYLQNNSKSNFLKNYFMFIPCFCVPRILPQFFLSSGSMFFMFTIVSLMVHQGLVINLGLTVFMSSSKYCFS